MAIEQQPGAEQLADGPLTRREAIRKLTQLAVAATGTALVAACSSGRNGRRRHSRTRK